MPGPTKHTVGLSIAPVRGGADRRAFLGFPRQLYQHDPNWIGPLEIEERKKLIPRLHPFYEHGEGAYWIARRGRRPVGRIAALVNHLHLEHHADATGHFGLLEAVDDQEVFDGLLDVAGDWLRARGMARIMGPFNLSINEEPGLLVEGFDTPPMILMGHAQPYYAARLEAAGLAKAKELYAFLIDLDAPIPPAHARLVERIRKRSDVSVRRSTRATLADDLRLAIEVFNDGWSSNWGFVPITRAESEDFIKTVRPVLDPGGVVFAERDGRTLAIMAAIPNINEAIRDLGGRLLPFGWARALWRLRVTGLRSGRIFMMGVRKELHGTLRGGYLTVLLTEAIREQARALGYRYVELSWILEDNRDIIGYVESVDGRRYKTYRIFQAAL